MNMVGTKRVWMIVWEVINAKIVLWLQPCKGRLDLDGKERRAHDDAKELKLEGGASARVSFNTAETQEKCVEG